MKHKVLRYWMLKATCACPTQRMLFKEVFGYQVTINKKNLLKAHKAGLDIFWFMRIFIGYENKNEFSRYVSEQWHEHNCQLGYDYTVALSNIIDYFLPIFAQQTHYHWSEAPF